MTSSSSISSRVRMTRRQAVTLAAIATGSLATSRSAAQQATPVGTASEPAALAPQILATGLLSPRFMALHGGHIYFTESGTGGEEPVFLNEVPGTPAPADPVSFTGLTGRLSRLEADETVTPIVSDFRSYTFGEMGEIVGAAGVAFDSEGMAYVAIGAPGPFVGMMTLLGDEGVVIKVDPTTGEKTTIANLVQYEIDNDPDPVTIDSNLYGMAFLDGSLYVADAGGNSIISVDVATGEMGTFAVPAGLPAPFMVNGNPNRLNAQEIDSVPSTVVVGPDGRLYVSFVTGGPFPENFAPVWAYSLDGSHEVVAEGLTMVGDLAFSSDGTLYACIISTSFVKQQPGQVVRILADGSHEVVIDGLPVPNAIEFDEAGNLYVLTKVVGFPEGGELWRFAGVATAPGSTPTTDPQATPVAAGPGASEPRSIAFIDTAFEPTTLTIPADMDITFNFVNTGFLAHDFHIDSPEINSGVLLNQEVSSVVVNLPAGEYTYYCTQIGHRALGMEGKLIVR